MIQMITGIILVHWPNGWSVVGDGHNGMEFSLTINEGWTCST